MFTTRWDIIYNLRNFQEVYCEKKKTIRYGNETITYKAAELWELLPYDIKNSPILIVSASNHVKLPRNQTTFNYQKLPEINRIC